MSTKQEVALRLLENNRVLYVEFVPMAFRVVVPKHLKQQATVCLSFGYDMPKPVTAMVVSKTAIEGVLSFGGTDMWCHVPWSTVFRLTNDAGHGQIWPEDVPTSLGSEKKSRGHLTYVKGGAILSKPAIGVLRLVKT